MTDSAMLQKQSKGSKFVYVTYIRTSQQQLWEALLKPEFTRKYWFDTVHVCDWKVGSPWSLENSEHGVCDTGKMLEIDEPNKLVLEWKNEFRPELKTEGASKATFILESAGDLVRLTVVHEIDVDNSKFIEAVSNGWPAILSSLKSLLETGKAHELPKGAFAKR